MTNGKNHGMIKYTITSTIYEIPLVNGWYVTKEIENKPDRKSYHGGDVGAAHITLLQRKREDPPQYAQCAKYPPQSNTFF